jgi:hypothetical protein
MFWVSRSLIQQFKMQWEMKFRFFYLKYSFRWPFNSSFCVCLPYTPFCSYATGDINLAINGVNMTHPNVKKRHTQQVFISWSTHFIISIIQDDQKVSLQCFRTIPTQLMIWGWPSQNTFGIWTMLLNTVFENTLRRVNKCLETGRGHFKHYF